MDRFLLKFLDVFAFLFLPLGVNYTHLRAIVEIKLTMDNRRHHSAFKRKNQSEPSNTFLRSLFYYCLLGGLVAVMFYNIDSFMISMIIFFSYIMVMIAMILITDFSSVLLDTSDNTIILPRPVESRTLFAARLTHIFLYLAQITVGLCAIPAAVVLLKYGLATLILFLFANILSAITSVFLTNTVYLLILRFSNEEKLRNVINYFQIIITILIMAGYQLLPRFAGQMHLGEYDFKITWWSFFVPPVWMAGAMESWHRKLFDAPHIGLIACATIIPWAGLYFINRYLTPLFTRKLGMLGSNSGSAKPGNQKKGFVRLISPWISANLKERGAFELVYQLLGHDRKIKLKIYPAYGYVLVFALAFLFRGNEAFITTWNNLPATHYYLVVLYLNFMILQTAFYEISYSDEFKASWIYFSAPLENPGPILAGSLKAMVIRVFLPCFVFCSLLVMAIWGAYSMADIAFSFFNNLLMLMFLAMLNKRSLPFSLAPSLRNQSNSFVRSLMMMLSAGILGFVHYALRKNTMIILAALPLQIVLLCFLFLKYKKTTWNQLTI